MEKFKWYLEKNGTLRDVFYFPRKIKSIIPEGIIALGPHCFKNKKLPETLYIPETIEAIGEGAFYNVKGLKTLIIPNSVKFIGDRAFRNCSELERIRVPEKVIWGEKVFLDCPKLKWIYQGENKLRVFYFPVHSQFAITTEQKDLSTTKYKVFVGKFVSIDFPKGEQRPESMPFYFCTVKKKDKEYFWYDKNLQQAIKGVLYFSSQLSYYDYFHKEYGPEDYIYPADFSLLTGICSEGVDWYLRVRKQNWNTKYQISDILNFFYTWLPKVYKRAMYAFSHQREVINLLDVENGITWAPVKEIEQKIKEENENNENK